TPRRLELSGSLALSPPLRQETPAGIELLDTTVAFVGDINISDEIHCDAARKKEGAVEAAVTTPLQQRLAVGLEFLNARVARVGDIYIAVLIRRNAPGHVESTHVGSTPGEPEFSPRFLRVAFRVELLYTVVSAVGHVHGIVRSDSQPAGIVKLAF